MQELVVESLVVSLAMVVFYVLVDETTQMPLAERDHACETLLFDRPDEPLGIGVEIGTLRRQPNRLNTGALQDLAKDPRIEGIAVVNQMARPAQTAIDRVGQIAGLLLHPRAARLRVDPGDGHAAGSQLDHEEDEVPPEPRQRQHLDGEQIAGRQALPVRLQERLPGHVPAPLGRRVDSVVVQDPLHRGPGDSVAEVRERAADPRVAPPRIVDRHPDHELGDVLSGHWSTSTSAGAAIVFLGDQSPVPTQDRIRGDDARDLRQDPPAEFVTAHSESTTLGVRQAKRPRAQVFSEDPILLPEIVDQIVLVTVHPASEREDEELQRRRHSLRLLGRLDQHRPSLGRFFAPYAYVCTPDGGWKNGDTLPMIGDPYCGQFHDTHISNFRWFTTEVGARGASEVTMVGGGNSICGVAAGVCKEREDPWNSSYDPDDPKYDPNDEAYSPNYDDGNGNVYQWVNVYPINP